MILHNVYIYIVMTISICVENIFRLRKRHYGPSCKTARDVLDGELSAIFDLQLRISLILKGLTVLFASIAIQN